MYAQYFECLINSLINRSEWCSDRPISKLIPQQINVVKKKDIITPGRL